MRILFESAGHRVSIAASVAEALGVGTRDPAGLVLLDLTLPDGDGLALVTPLLAAGCRTIVALTGLHDSESRSYGFALSKPMDVRVYALGEGSIVGEVDPKSVTEEQIGMMMTGGS